MNLVSYILGGVILICIILLWAVSTYNKFQNYIVKINEAENNIDAILRKRYDLLNKAVGVINDFLKIKDNKISPLISKLKAKKISNFELDRELYNGINEFYLYRNNRELKETEGFIKIDASLMESEIEIMALRKYYNDIITEYNKLAKSFPALIIAKMFGHKYRLYFDGKNMEDTVINDFKL